MRLVLCLSLGLCAACETPNDIGEVCSEIPRIVSETMQPQVGETRVVQDVAFERCAQFLCISVEGHNPYCTRRCQVDSDCPEHFSCEHPVEFGPLSRVCADDGGPCEPADYCVRKSEWEDPIGTMSDGGPTEPAADSGPAP
ncbi:MAG: hypothetical protein CMH55_01985 [Myxococcales bacterium]|nr:hypothetical protein [Myxococcales bacterium]